MTLDLFGVFGADEDASDFRAAQDPGNGELNHCAAFVGGNGFELVGDGEVLCKEIALEAGECGAFVVFGELRDGCVFAGEQAFCKGAVCQDADAGLGTVREVFGFNVAVKHIVAGLAGVEWCNAVGGCHLCGVEVGDANETGFALFLQLGHCGHTVFNGVLVAPAVNLVEVYVVGVEAAQAVFNGLFNVFGFVAAADFGGQETPFAVTVFEGTA